MQNGNHNNNRLSAINPLKIRAIPAILIVILAVLLLGILYISKTNSIQSESRILTEKHGIEVQAAIEKFETNWLSLEAHLNPIIQSELATGSYLDYWGYSRAGKSILEEPFWLITKSASVIHVRVLEYSPERFKAVAQIDIMGDETNPKGEYIRTSPPYQRCRIYMFIKVDELWKLSVLFDASNPMYVEKDWRNFNESWKEIIGDVPSQALSNCEEFLSH